MHNSKSLLFKIYGLGWPVVEGEKGLGWPVVRSWNREGLGFWVTEKMDWVSAFLGL